MNYLADENVARRIVEWLRRRGDDVLYASEERGGEIDAVWLREAETDRRLILTSDKDFGELIFRDGLNSHGVMLFRLEKLSIDARLK
jgi:predicted nuclease of predicted toxin-antitoxin system